MQDAAMLQLGGVHARNPMQLSLEGTLMHAVRWTSADRTAAMLLTTHAQMNQQMAVPVHMNQTPVA